jgi:hypothetical protein
MGFMGALKALGVAKEKAVNKAKSSSGGTAVPQTTSVQGTIAPQVGQSSSEWTNVPKIRKDR